ncbi:hypothetical protein TNCV_3049351 [Trichonephila clavipes]|nr:hypothetical protein TNCV_3049351 [Trichonephila clavipes]
MVAEWYRYQIVTCLVTSSSSPVPLKTRCVGADIVDEFLAVDDTQREYWLPRSPDLSPIEYVWDGLGRASS